MASPLGGGVFSYCLPLLDRSRITCGLALRDPPDLGGSGSLGTVVQFLRVEMSWRPLITGELKASRGTGSLGGLARKQRTSDMGHDAMGTLSAARADRSIGRPKALCGEQVAPVLCPK